MVGAVGGLGIGCTATCLWSRPILSKHIPDRLFISGPHQGPHFLVWGGWSSHVPLSTHQNRA